MTIFIPRFPLPNSLVRRNGTVDEQIGKTIERLRYYIPVSSVKFAET